MTVQPVPPAPTTPPTSSSASGGAPGDPREILVERARALWLGKLIDLSRNNGLLYFRPLKVGTIDLHTPPEGAIVDLATGQKVPLARLLPAAELHGDVDEELLLLEPDLVPDDQIGAVRRLNEIRRKATENFEERGLETMYLAYGMATWAAADGGREANAPVILIPVGVEGRDARVALVRRGDVEVNLVLLHMLAQSFDCHLPEDLDERLDVETSEALGDAFTNVFSIIDQSARHVSGFSISRQAVIGNFSFQKLAMVRDLERLGARLASNDVVAAMAGDMGARAALQGGQHDIDPVALDGEPPDQEFLVLDADSSQRRVVASVLSGQSGVIAGPPGTGKSQTIANVIAEMAAAGKRVLFVAEKRAALEVVKNRLTGLGLGHLVLDLHGGVVKREIMAQFAESLAMVDSGPGADVAALHRDYAARRDALNEHARRMHSPVAPTNLSVYQLQGLLIGADPGSRTQVRWRSKALLSLTEERVGEVCDALLPLGGFADLLQKTNPSRWVGASLHSPTGAQSAVTAAGTIASALPDLMADLDRLVTETGLGSPATLDEARALADLVSEASALADLYEAPIFGEDLPALCIALAPATRGGLGGAFARMSGRHRRAVRYVASIRKQKTSPTELLSELLAAARLRDAGAASGPSGREAEKSSALSLVLAGLETVRAAIVELSVAWPVATFQSMSLDALLSLMHELARDILTPMRMVRTEELSESIRKLGAAGIVEDVVARDIPSDLWPATMKYAWWASLLDSARLADAALAAFSGRTHERIAEDFRELDQHRIEVTVARVRQAHAGHMAASMKAKPQATAVVRHEAGKRMRHKPLRRLIAEAGPVLTALKPCWMASPLSVSQFLDGEGEHFDLVMFDEASQVLPEDAVSAILRGRATVVAGDRHQLPPTPFFVAGSGTDLDTADEAEATEGYESILDVLEAVFRPSALQWHYRSRDERLIAFSNHAIYGDSLVTFPGVGRTSPIRHVLVDGRSGELVSGSSAAEVERVVALIAQHARTHPERSLGVIAMGLPHARRIELRLDAERRVDPTLDAWLDSDEVEPWFIKNLERVQGDERDSIILTIGCGKNGAGRLDGRSFGPLNGKSGRRRLNVAITRARTDVTVVSSFSALDMDPGTKATGVELLRQYLEYAAGGGARLADRGMTGVLSNEFEQDVENALRARGIDLLPQYGFSSYRIDLVARHPQKPGALVLAIECDGATYHSAPMARDRDRLRQQHLEALGWRFCRIWSTDWFLRREEEIERVVAAYKAAVRRFDRGGDVVVERVSASASPFASNGHDAAVVAPEGAISRGEAEPLAERASPTRSTELEPPRHLATPAPGAANGSAPATNTAGSARASSLTPVYSSNWQRRSPLSTSGPASRTKGAGPRAKKRVPTSPQHSRVAPYSAPRFNPGAVQAHECFMPGCDHYGPPGTCPVHDQC